MFGETNFPVDARSLFDRESDVEIGEKRHHLVRWRRRVHDETKLGSVFGNEIFESRDEIRIGIPTEVKLSGNARTAQRFDGVLETTTATDRLTEPVELQRPAGRRGLGNARR